MLIYAIIVFAIKELIHRPRPLNALIAGNSYSFPSGHTATAVLLLGFLIYFNRNMTLRNKIIATSISVILILLIGLSRVFLNVHWATDVIGGLALGMFILTGGILLKHPLEENAKPIYNKYKQRIGKIIMIQ